MSKNPKRKLKTSLSNLLQGCSIPIAIILYIVITLGFSEIKDRKERNNWWNICSTYEADEVYNRLELYDSLGCDGYINEPFAEFANKIKAPNYAYDIYQIANEEGYIMFGFDFSNFEEFYSSLFNECEIIETNLNRNKVATCFHLHKRFSNDKISMQEFADRLLSKEYRHSIYLELKKNRINKLGEFEDFEHNLKETEEMYFDYYSELVPHYIKPNIEATKAVYSLLYQSGDMPLNFEEFHNTIKTMANVEELYTRLIGEFGEEIKDSIGETLNEFKDYLCQTSN
jgi:hypothetical protein